jgi:hypothetical protein
MKATTLGILTILAIFLVANRALTDPPAPSFSIDFSGDSAIWNPFDGFVACESLFGATLCLSIDNLACDGRGNCTGESEFDFTGSLSGSTTGSATAKTTCKATGNVNKPVCNAMLRFDTAGVVSNCDTTIAGNVKGPVDSNGFFSGKGTGKVCLECPGERRQCTPARGSFDYMVRPPSPWSLTVEVVQNGNKLQGKATDTLGFSYTAKGAYNLRKDTSNISLKGEKNTPSQGAAITLKNIVTVGSSVVGGTANINVQGNKSKADLEP